MGQIVGLKSKPKRCNLNALGSVPTPAAGEYILVSYDNSMTANGQGNFDRYIIGDGRTAATALELKYLDDSTRPYIVEEVNKAVADIQPIEITGDVTNAPDEEDLTSEKQGNTDVLKFKDKAYNAALYSGLGRVYLRKNIVTLEGTGKNVLTQAMVNTANTIYHIQYDYDLNGQTITLSAGCVLEFEGGSIKNGTLTGDYTLLEGVLQLNGVTLAGTWKNEAFTLYDIGCVPDDSNEASNNATKINSFATILTEIKKDLIVPEGEWHFDAPIVLDGTYSLLCEGRLVYDCTSFNVSNTALTIGTTSTNFSKKQKINIRQNVSGYTFPSSPIPDNVGVKFVNAYFATIDVNYARDFAYCVMFVGTSTGSAYNHITIGSIGWNNCYTALSVIADGGDGWINENIFIGTEVHNQSINVYKNSMIGIYLCGSTSHLSNNNVFIKPCVEGCAVGIKLDNAIDNSFSDVRSEAATQIVQTENTCQANLVKIYKSNNIFKQPSTIVTNADDASVLERMLFKEYTSYVLWPVSSDSYISGIHLDAATYYYTDIGNSVKCYGANYYLGHIVNTTDVKDFIVRTQVSTRFVVRCFDSNGNVLTSDVFAYSFIMGLSTDGITYKTETNTRLMTFGFTAAVKSAFIGTLPDAKIIEVGAYCRNVPNIINDKSGIINTSYPKYTIDAIAGDKVYNQTTKTFNYWNGEKWEDFDGLTAGFIRRGSSLQRPTLGANEYGLDFFDSDLGKHIYAGIKTLLFNKTLAYKGSTNDKYFYALAAGNYYARKTTANGVISVWLSTTNDIDNTTLVKIGEFSRNIPLYIDITADDLLTYGYIMFQNEYGSSNTFEYYSLDMTKWSEGDGAIAGVLRSGNTASRPASTDIYAGFEYFDTTIGKPIYWNGSGWVDATGVPEDNSLKVLAITQSAYDALATKDPNTLYIIS